MIGKVILAVVIIVVVAFVFLIVVGILLVGEEEPVEVHSANFQDEGDHFEVYFTLHDADSDYVKADGNVTVTIKDDYNATLYSDTFLVEKSDFKWYETLFGVNILAYKWDIPYSEVNKSYSGGYSLDGIITFEYKGTEMSSGEEYVPLPDALKATIYEIFNLTVNDHGRWGSGYHAGDVYVNVTMENICPYQQDLRWTSWDIETSDGLVFGWSGDDPNPPDKLNSGASFTWIIYFDVPEAKTPVKIIYHDELEVAL
ncbi:MAG: hypothetical protein ACE5KV_03680 [Thermoplasmata archaeon]